MQKISVVIITYNEEKDIGRCLDAVKDVADDIVVVDSFSTDRTEEICKEKGARFVQHKFEGHIQQKNWAITQARYPHVLSLDADEVVSERLQKEILKVKENWQADGYYFNRMTNYCGKWIKHCGWYPDRKIAFMG
jgi:glycosyltransferase involved in cell wall biosynthesis